MKLVTAQQMRELEQRADASGNTFAAMMERAGTLTAQTIMQRWDVRNRRVLVLVGPGNNGGDGLVCARVLHDAGATVELYLWRRVPREDDVNWRLCLERGIGFARAEEDADFSHLRRGVASAAIVVDALLGTGVARPIEGTLKDLLLVVREELYRAPPASDLIAPNRPASSAPPRPFVVAVDLPTGLNPDTGALDSAAVPADLTVTFALPKVGHYCFPGADAVGELVVADILIPREWADDIPLDVATADEIRALLPGRRRDSNKGTYGRALLACGSLGFTGAPALAAAAAYRAGAGLVTLALPRTVQPIVAAQLMEVTYLPLPDRDGAWSPRAVKPLVERAQDYDALLVGCGFGRAPSTQAFVENLFGMRRGRAYELPPLVIDADALNALAALDQWWARARFATPPILTPHPGEMARLLGTTVPQVQADRIGCAREAARQWNAIVVLKGAFTVIAAPDRRVTLLPFANPALATAGTGDVLAGAIVGLLAQYRAASKRGASNVPDDAYRAALVGAYLHALAGERVREQIGEAGAVAGDLIARLPEAIRSLVAGR